MEVIKRSSQGPHKFRVTRPFLWSVKFVQPGEVIEAKYPECDGMVRTGRMIPDDIPEVGTYITLRNVMLPGKKEKFEAKSLEVVELKAGDALALMLEGAVIPKSDDQWRPANRKLKTKK